MTEKEPKCRDCKPPERHPGCHATCEAYLTWRKERDIMLEEIRKKEWLKDIGRTPIKKRNR